MIARTRRRALLAARAFRDTGAAPPGVEDAAIFMQSRSGYFILEDGIDWREAYARQVRRAERPVRLPHAAE